MAQLPSALAIQASHPSIKAAALGLNGEVDDGGGASPGRRPGAGLEAVRSEGSTERKLHVGVDVDAPRNDVLAGGVDHLVGCPLASSCSQGGDLVAFDEDVSLEAPGVGDNETILDKDGHLASIACGGKSLPRACSVCALCSLGT